MRSLLRASTSFACVAALSATVGIGGVLSVGAPARAQECAGNPDALGTSRVLAIEQSLLPRVGVMQYRQTLPLADKEVVLTFDDGPLPRYSNPILDILAAQCVQVTYFLVGNMARANPAVVRRIYEAGHSIGTHTEDHPSRLQKLPIEKVRQEIDEGIADVGAALGDPKELAPFFRIPGLARSDAIEAELAARSLIVFSSDTVADDWHRRIKPSEIVRRAMSRLEARGKGILLLHDIHAATAAALPELLKALKEKAFTSCTSCPAQAAASRPQAARRTRRTRWCRSRRNNLAANCAARAGHRRIRHRISALAARDAAGRPECCPLARRIRHRPTGLRGGIAGTQPARHRHLARRSASCGADDEPCRHRVGRPARVGPDVAQ